jgi:signal peptidase I
VAPEGTPAPAATKRHRSFFKELPFLIGVALILALLIKAFVVQAFYIPSGSMENTLRVGDRVLVNKLVYDFRDVHRGDVVVFSGADSWTSEVTIKKPSNPVAKALTWVGGTLGITSSGEKDFIKRVIGVPGDHVVCCNAEGQITVNGVALDENYLYPGNVPSATSFDVTVPKGRLWVMGDHRAESSDSRSHLQVANGTIPINKVVGRAFVVVWPVSHVESLPVPKTFSQAALKASEPLIPAAPLALGLVGALPIVALRRRLHDRSAARKAAVRDPFAQP